MFLRARRARKAPGLVNTTARSEFVVFCETDGGEFQKNVSGLPDEDVHTMLVHCEDHLQYWMWFLTRDNAKLKRWWVEDGKGNRLTEDRVDFRMYVTESGRKKLRQK